MPHPICVQCAQEMTCEKNGDVVYDRKVGDFGSTFFRTDRYKCGKCGFEVYSGFSRGQIASTDEEQAELARTGKEFKYT